MTYSLDDVWHWLNSKGVLLDREEFETHMVTVQIERQTRLTFKHPDQITPHRHHYDL